MIPKKTEDTITVMLKEELGKRGVRAEAFPEIKTPVSMRKPDLYCKNGGAYVVEAKFKERDLWKAVAKIQNDYIKYHRILGVSGGFAVLYPEELAKSLPIEVVQELAKRSNFKIVLIFRPEDTRRNFHVVEGTIADIADELSKQILTPPEFVEPSVGYIIGTLRDIASEITAGLRHLSGSQLEDLFGGKHVFENILLYEENKYPEEELRLASAYLLVNQLLFYHVISRRMPKLFKELDPDHIASPSLLQKYFSNVLDVNYQAIFSYDVASRIPKNFTSQVKEMIAAIQGLSTEKVGGDLLGTIFHDLIPFDLRKKVAAFYTNVLAAELLAHLTVNECDSKVTDFACGSGGLLVAAYRRKRELLAAERSFTAGDHRRFVENDLLGVDVMPFAANVAASHLALQSPEFFTNRVRIAIWDSTELVPETKIPSIAHLKLVLRGQQNLDVFFEPGDDQGKKGVVTLGTEEPEEIELEHYDTVIMNPPFTRQERMPKEYKDILSERFNKYSEYLHGQMGYYGYFILLADRFLKEGGRLAFVLPAAFLRTRSAESIRKLISERYNIEYVITGKEKLNFSEATWRREILFVARKLRGGEAKGDSFFVALSSLPENPTSVRNLSVKIKQIKEDHKDKEMTVLSVPHKELEDDLDWFRFIASFGEAGISQQWESVSNIEGLVPFKDVYDLDSVMKRGIETSRGMKVQAVLIPSSEERAIRKEDLWILHKVQRDHIVVCKRDLPEFTVTIPIGVVEPALRTIAGNSFMDLSDRTDFVVVRNFPESGTFFVGKRRSLIEVLSDWQRYVMDRKGNLIVLRRFPINAPGTMHLCYYSSVGVAGPGTTWVAKIPDGEAKILTLWFNSSLHLAQVFHERIEDIWLDVHKYILKEMLVLNPRSLSEEKREKLMELFDDISQKPFPSLEEQYTDDFELRRRMDSAILDALGFDEEETDLLLEQLYEAIRMQFDSLKEL